MVSLLPGSSKSGSPRGGGHFGQGKGLFSLFFSTSLTLACHLMSLSLVSNCTPSTSIFSLGINVVLVI